MDAAQLFARIAVAGAAKAKSDLQSFGASVDHTQARLGRFGKGVGELGAGLVRIGAVAGTALVAGLGAASASAMGYQQSMELLATQTGATQAEVDSMSQALLKLSTTTGTGPDTLAAGLYHIESAGKRGAEALDILTAAAQGAKVGNANLEDVVNALVAADQSGIKGVKSMAGAMGTLNAIVGSGNMRMQDLVASLGSGIMAAGRTFGVSLQSVGAALATLTDEGVPAEEASTRLRMSLSLMGAPTSKAAKELKAVGLAQLDLANAMRSPGGLVSAVKLLRDHLQKAGMIDASGNVNSKGAALLSGAFGGGKSSSTIMTLVGNYSLLEQKQKAVNAGAAGFGDAIAKTQETASYQFGQLVADAKMAAISVGEGIAPALGRLAGKAADLIKAHQQDLVGFGQSIGKAIDDIPWDKVEKGAETVYGLLKAGFNVLKLIPPQVDVVVASFLGLNKLSGGMFGKGLTDIVGGLVGGIGGGLMRGIASKVPGLGRFAGTPVYVVNWPAGFGGGLGGGGLLAKAGGAVGGIGLGTLAVGAGITAIAAAAVGATYLVQKQGLDKQSDTITSAIDAQTKDTQTSNADLARSYLAVLDGQKQLNGNLFTQFGGLIFGTDQKMNGNLDELRQALTERGISLDDATLRRLAAGEATAVAGINRHLSGAVHYVEDVGQGSEQYDPTRLMNSATALAQLYESSTAPSGKSLGNAVRVFNEAAAEARKHKDTATAVELERMAGQLASKLDAINASIKADPINVQATLNAWVQTNTINPHSFEPTSPMKPMKTPAPSPRDKPRLSASGLLGMTDGLTDLGYAGEAGREAVAIIRNPRRITQAAQALTVKVTTMVSTASVQKAQARSGLYGPLIPVNG